MALNHLEQIWANVQHSRPDDFEGIYGIMVQLIQDKMFTDGFIQTRWETSDQRISTDSRRFKPPPLCDLGALSAAQRVAELRNWTFGLQDRAPPSMTDAQVEVPPGRFSERSIPESEEFQFEGEDSGAGGSTTSSVTSTVTKTVISGFRGIQETESRSRSRSVSVEAGGDNTEIVMPPPKVPRVEHQQPPLPDLSTLFTAVAGTSTTSGPSGPVTGAHFERQLKAVQGKHCSFP